MTETGWPLIPREVLPAPVPAARRRLPARASLPADLSRQLPFFGAETTEPAPGDLVGLLAGPGRLGRMGGTARVSVEVDAAWRVHVLVAELVARGLVTNWRPILQDQSQDQGQDQSQDQNQDPDVRDDARDGPADVIQVAENHQEPESRPIGAFSLAADEPVATDPGDDDPSAGRPIPVQGDLSPPGPRESLGDDAEPDRRAAEENKGTDHNQMPTPRFEVRTAYSRRLNGLARGWPEAAAQLFLSGPRLRLWVAAAGAPAPGGYALGLDPGKDLTAIDAALVRAGLAGKLSDGGRCYLIMGKRRLRRLAELVGERPSAAPADRWPGGAGA